VSGMVRDEVERKSNDADDRTVTIWRTCPQGIDPQQNCQEKQVGTGVVNCEVSCDWRFHPLPARRNFCKNGLLLSPSVFSSWVAAKK
jgi:hypothetical protein